MASAFCLIVIHYSYALYSTQIINTRGMCGLTKIGVTNREESWSKITYIQTFSNPKFASIMLDSTQQRVIGRHSNLQSKPLSTVGHYILGHSLCNTGSIYSSMKLLMTKRFRVFDKKKIESWLTCDGLEMPDSRMCMCMRVSNQLCFVTFFRCIAIHKLFQWNKFSIPCI